MAAAVTYALQRGYENTYEQGDRFYLLAFEFLIYAVFLGVFLGKQTGRLKSGPDSSKVTAEQLTDEDSSVQVYIALYLFVLMLVVVGKTIFFGSIEEVSMGPWGMFMAATPLFLIVFWRQYRAENRRESS